MAVKLVYIQAAISQSTDEAMWLQSRTDLAAAHQSKLDAFVQKQCDELDKALTDGYVVLNVSAITISRGVTLCYTLHKPGVSMPSASADTPTDEYVQESMS